MCVCSYCLCADVTTGKNKKNNESVAQEQISDKVRPHAEPCVCVCLSESHAELESMSTRHHGGLRGGVDTHVVMCVGCLFVEDVYMSLSGLILCYHQAFPTFLNFLLEHT